jgi:hypothetical protein
MKAIGLGLIVVGILLGLILLPIVFLGKNYPTAALIAPILCGEGYEIVVEFGVNENATRLRSLIGSTAQCVDAQGNVGEQDPNGILLVLGMVPAVVLATFGFAIYNAGAMLGGFSGMKEMTEISKVPEVKVQLDALLDDFKAGRVSYEDYTAMSKTIIESYKARQAAS